MALIVEDGSIVPNANSYNSNAAIVAYALARAIVLDPTKVDGYAIIAMDYLQSYDNRWKGDQVSPGVQALAWPRMNVVIGTSATAIPSNVIPPNVRSAQCQLCIYVSQGIVLMPVGNTAPFITMEKIGPIETQYSADVQIRSGSTPDMPAIFNLLDPYLDFGGGFIRSVRL